MQFIDAHLDEPLSLERLSAIAAFSKFHFHRQFTEWFGLGVFKYVQLTRLRSASYRLAYRDEQSVLQIAVESGYEGAESFARAYRKTLGQSPSTFRKEPDWDAWYDLYHQMHVLRSEHMQTQFQAGDVHIVNCPGARIAVLEHRGDPRKLGDSIRRFIQWRRVAGLHPRTSATYNVLYDDPAQVQPEDYRFDLCAAIERDIAPNEYSICEGSLPAGRCAKLKIVGGDATMADGVRFLYSHWLPQSSEELRDFPLFLERRSFFPDVPEHEQQLDLFLPLRE